MERILSFIPQPGAIDSTLDHLVSAWPAGLRLYIDKNGSMVPNLPLPAYVGISLGESTVRVGFEGPQETAATMRQKYQVGNKDHSLHAIAFGSRLLTLDLGSMPPADVSAFRSPTGLAGLKYRAWNLAREPAAEVLLSMACEAVPQGKEKTAPSLLAEPHAVLAAAKARAAKETKSRAATSAASDSKTKTTGGRTTSSSSSSSSTARKLVEETYSDKARPVNGAAGQAAGGAPGSTTDALPPSLDDLPMPLLESLLNGTAATARSQGMDITSYRLTAFSARYAARGPTQTAAARTVMGLLAERALAADAGARGEQEEEGGTAAVARRGASGGGAAQAGAGIPHQQLPQVPGEGISSSPLGLTSAYICSRETVAALGDLRGNTLFELVTGTWIRPLLIAVTWHLQMFKTVACFLLYTLLSFLALWPVLQCAVRAGQVRGGSLPAGHLLRLTALTSLLLTVWVNGVCPWLPPAPAVESSSGEYRAWMNTMAAALRGPQELGRALNLSSWPVEVVLALHILCTLFVVAHWYDDGPDFAPVGAVTAAAGQAATTPPTPPPTAATAQPSHSRSSRGRGEQDGTGGSSTARKERRLRHGGHPPASPSSAPSRSVSPPGSSAEGGDPVDGAGGSHRGALRYRHGAAGQSHQSRHRHRERERGWADSSSHVTSVSRAVSVGPATTASPYGSGLYPAYYPTMPMMPGGIPSPYVPTHHSQAAAQQQQQAAMHAAAMAQAQVQQAQLMAAMQAQLAVQLQAEQAALINILRQQQQGQAGHGQSEPPAPPACSTPTGSAQPATTAAAT